MTQNDIITVVLLCAALLAAGSIVAMYFMRQSRTRRLREQFGPEYEKAVEQIGDRDVAEDRLEAVAARFIDDEVAERLK